MAAPGASDTVIVVTGGDPVDGEVLRHVPRGALVIAADSGIEHALAIGLAIDVAVGDFDSVAPGALQAAVDGGAVLERHPSAKDATDLELALDAAVACSARHIHVLGGHGGRLDHLLANALLLASPRYAATELTAHMGQARVAVVRSHATLRGATGDLVSLLALHGRVRGVTTHGLLYALHDAELLPGSTRGVSNELISADASVHVDDGVLLAVQPGPSDPRHPRTTTT
jgi:thiamine pyrophosphokinase